MQCCLFIMIFMVLLWNYHEQASIKFSLNWYQFDFNNNKILNITMQPQQKQQTKIKTPLKKKIRNKNWGTVDEDNSQEPAILPQHSIFSSTVYEKKQKKYRDLTQLALKYSFNIQAILGSGFASTVYLGAKLDTKQLVCIKAVDLIKINLSSQFISLIHKEIECLYKFNSDFIVKILDVYQSNTFYYLVMELCPGGDLYKMLKVSPINLPTKFVNCIINQIVLGLKEIHEKNIVHRDLKTENIFIQKFPQNENEEIRVKIGDLGFCITSEELQELRKEGKKAQDVGSPIYMSVQACQDQKYSFSSDIYSVGIIWYELLHKKAPWQAKSQAELLENKLKVEPTIWREDISTGLKQVIKKCISNNPQQRPSCSQLLERISKLNQTQEQI